jgi:DNA mismatch repair protein MutL
MGIIQLLPDAIANQIAAGEVIQRPASVVKELVENAIDAKATRIELIVRDAGRTLIQVTDNGSGMSDVDARLAFERHATSKIRSADDLFDLRTMGFRGEALASIAAVAEVTLRSRRAEDELGTEVCISGSLVTSQETVQCSEGSNFMIKNLFFNVPARRKFLKSNPTEFKHVVTEFQRIVLAYPDIEFTLVHNDTEIYYLPQTHLRQRIVHVFGKSIATQLLDVNSQTSLAGISGFIAKPEYARKSTGEQFFFVNGRFMRHPVFHRAVCDAFGKVLPPDAIPVYFIYLDTDPSTIDVNIHPTKTEIKFESEQALRQIIHATVRESLGKFNIMPSLDFDAEPSIVIPVVRKGDTFNMPTIDINPDFNPFADEAPSSFHQRSQQNNSFEHLNTYIEKRDPLPVFPKDEFKTESDDSLSLNGETSKSVIMQFKQRYLLTQVKSGLMVIDQKRAHERILFEQYATAFEGRRLPVQRVLFPQRADLDTADYLLLTEYSEELKELGFELSELGHNTVVINAYPSITKDADPLQLFTGLLHELREGADPASSHHELAAAAIARASAIPYGRILSVEEMNDLFNRLFATSNPNYSPDGKLIVSIVPTDDIERKLR